MATLGLILSFSQARWAGLVHPPQHTHTLVSQLHRGSEDQPVVPDQVPLVCLLQVEEAPPPSPLETDQDKSNLRF